MIRKRTYIAIPSLLVITAATVAYFALRENPTAIMAELPPMNIVLSVDEIGDGIPPQAGGQLVQKSGFWLLYNEEFEQANWTAYILTRNMVITGEEPRSDNFRADTSVTTGSAVPDDYRGSGYDRGHLVPAADMKWSVTSMIESFLMSNMSPQKPGFNRGIWRRLKRKSGIGQSQTIVSSSSQVLFYPELMNLSEKIMWLCLHTILRSSSISPTLPIRVLHFSWKITPPPVISLNMLSQ